MCCSNDGKYIISGSCDKTIKVWSLEHLNEVKTLTGHYGKSNYYIIIKIIFLILTKNYSNINYQTKN